MSKNYLNLIFPFLETITEREREVITIVSFSIISFLICVIAAVSILPEHCSFFSSNIESGFACDGIDWRTPKPCAICRNKGVATAASIIAGLGFGSFFVPFAVFALRNFRNRSVKPTKLFD